MERERLLFFLSLDRATEKDIITERSSPLAHSEEKRTTVRPSVRLAVSYSEGTRDSPQFFISRRFNDSFLSLSFSPAPHSSSLNAVCGKAAWRHTLTLIGYNSVYKRRLEMVGPSRRKQKETVRRRNIKLRTGGGWRSRAREREQGGRRKIKVYKVRPTTVP